MSFRLLLDQIQGVQEEVPGGVQLDVLQLPLLLVGVLVLGLLEPSTWEFSILLSLFVLFCLGDST